MVLPEVDPHRPFHGLCVVSVDGVKCGRPAYQTSLTAAGGPICDAHFKRFQRHGGKGLASPLRGYGQAGQGACSAPGCARADDGAKGFCAYHYDRQARGRAWWPACRRCGAEMVGVYQRGRCHACSGE